MENDPDFRCQGPAAGSVPSRPVDIIFSIMRLQEATLDPSKFRKNDRVGTTIALYREKPEDTSWFFALPFAPPSPDYSIFPTFPETTEAGQAIWLMSDGTEVDVVEYCSTQRDPALFPQIEFPQTGPVVLDDEGCIHIKTILYPMAKCTAINEETIIPSGYFDRDDKYFKTKLYLDDVEGRKWELLSVCSPYYRRGRSLNESFRRNRRVKCLDLVSVIAGLSCQSGFRHTQSTMKFSYIVDCFIFKLQLSNAKRISLTSLRCVFANDLW